MTVSSERGSSRQPNAERDNPRWVLEPEPPEVFAPSADGPAPGVEYPDFAIRSLAFVIDLLLIQSTGTLLLQPAGFLASKLLLSTSGPPDQVVGSWLGFFLPVVIVAIIQALILAGFWRAYTASPGQMLTGLQTVRHADGHRVSRRAAFVRWLFLFFPALVLTASTDIGIWWSYALGKGTQADQTTASGMAITLPVIWYVVLLVSALVERHGRGLHDRLARSVVVRRIGS
jgi:uncharacterized RDD family membrane protein YckC